MTGGQGARYKLHAAGPEGLPIGATGRPEYMGDRYPGYMSKANAQNQRIDGRNVFRCSCSLCSDLTCPRSRNYLDKAILPPSNGSNI